MSATPFRFCGLVHISELPAPAYEGYIFDGWFTAATGGTKVTTDTPFTTDTTIYAQWTPVTVTFDPNGGSVSTASMTTTGGKLGTLPTPTRAGYTFDGWFTAADGGDEVTTEKVYEANATVYAHWTLITYIITFDANGGTVTTESGGSETAVTATTGEGGKLTELPAPTYEGYIFDGWFTVASGGTKVITDTEFAANTTLYAHWTPSVKWEVDGEALRIWGNGQTKNYTTSDHAPWYE